MPASSRRRRRGSAPLPGDDQGRRRPLYRSGRLARARRRTPKARGGRNGCAGSKRAPAIRARRRRSGAAAKVTAELDDAPGSYVLQTLIEARQRQRRSRLARGRASASGVPEASTMRPVDRARCRRPAARRTISARGVGCIARAAVDPRDPGCEIGAEKQAAERAACVARRWLRWRRAPAASANTASTITECPCARMCAGALGQFRDRSLRVTSGR